jgi:hypothetical protein
LAPPRIELRIGANDSRRNLNLLFENKLVLALLLLLPLLDDIPLWFSTIYLLVASYWLLLLL